MSNNAKAMKAGIWYTIGNFIANGMVFLVSPVFNKIMTKGEVGDFSNYSVWISLLVIIFTLNLNSALSVARFDYKDELDDFVGSSLVLGSSFTLFFYVLAIIFSDFITAWVGINKFELHVAFAYFLVSPALQMFQLKSRIEYKYRAATVVAFISTTVATLCSVVAIFVFEDKFMGRVAGNYIPLILMNIIIYIFLMTKVKKISTKYWKYALGISVPLAIHLLAGNILNMSDKIMIQNIRGNEENGLYSVAYSCGIIISVLWTSINGAWTPWAMEQMDGENYNELKRAEKILMIFWGILVTGVMLFGPELLFVIGWGKYNDSLNVIPPVMAAYGIQAVYTFYNNIETYSKKQHLIAINTVIAAITNIILNYIFINKYGYMAAAFTTLIGFVMMLIFHMAVVIAIGKGHWYDTKFNIGFSVFMIALMFVMLVLYRYPLVRYIVLSVIVLAVIIWLIINREIVAEAIREKSLSPITGRYVQGKKQ